MDNIILKQGNCLEIVKEIPSESINLIITDPPYKLNRTTGGRTSIGMENKWQGNIKAGNTVLDKHYYEIAKKTNYGVNTNERRTFILYDFYS